MERSDRRTAPLLGTALVPTDPTVVFSVLGVGRSPAEPPSPCWA
ncbi:hypothetical protein AB0E81_19350 [Streptomyces sp. NPDC033538]